MYILEEGIYNIICGFFPKAKAELVIKVNGKGVARHLCEEPPENNLARTIMLYIRVQRESQLVLECKSVEHVDGFLCLQKVSPFSF